MKSVTRKTFKSIGFVLGLLGLSLAGLTLWFYIRTTSIVGPAIIICLENYFIPDRISLAVDPLTEIGYA